jgi:hypothetical protein
MRSLPGSCRLISGVALSLSVSAFGLAGHRQPSGPIILGNVRTAGSGDPIAYSVVTVPALGLEQFTNDHGAFTLRGLPAGELRLRVRHLGFVPFDTTLKLADNDTVRLDVQLKRLTINLDAMRVVGSVRIHLAEGCPPFSTADEQAAIVQLLEQVVLNAEQYRLLVKNHPFIARFQDYGILRKTDGSFTEDPRAIEGARITDHFAVISSASPVYQAGNVIRHIHGSDQVLVPEIQDLADSVFIGKHCFAYGGDTTIVDTKMVRLSFRPVAELTDPDIEGTITLRAETYELREVDLRTTGQLPKKFASSIAAVRINTQFRDLLPGIAILSRLESFLSPGPESVKRDSTIASRGEVQTLYGVSWQRGPP